MASEPSPLIRAVCDTSTLVPFRDRKNLLAAAASSLFTPIWSPWIIGELYRVLAWKWAERYGITEAERRRCGESANKMMALLEEYWELVSAPMPWHSAWLTLADPNDQPIWATAKVGQAQYVVSNNTHDFPPANSQGKHIWERIEYLPAAVFLSDVLHI